MTRMSDEPMKAWSPSRSVHVAPPSDEATPRTRRSPGVSSSPSHRRRPLPSHTRRYATRPVSTPQVPAPAAAATAPPVSIGPQLAGPIFDAGRRGFGVKAAQARARQSLAAYEKAAQLAFREAADALNAYRKTGEIITETGKLVSSQKNVASIAVDRFQGGQSSYLEVLDAERQLFNAELDLADARGNRLRAVVQAYRALGGGWK